MGEESLCDGRRRDNNVPKAHIEPDTMNALVEVFHEARRRLDLRGLEDSDQLDSIARRILSLAREGRPPPLILQDILNL